MFIIPLMWIHEEEEIKMSIERISNKVNEVSQSIWE